jgi:hypothetical protein
VRVVVVLLAARATQPAQTGAEAGLPAVVLVATLPTLFMVSEEDAAAIQATFQATFEKEGELSAASNSAAG